MRAICCTFCGFMLPCLPIPLPICCMMPLPLPLPGPIIIVRILMYSPAMCRQISDRRVAYFAQIVNAVAVAGFAKSPVGSSYWLYT